MPCCLIAHALCPGGTLSGITARTIALCNGRIEATSSAGSLSSIDATDCMMPHVSAWSISLHWQQSLKGTGKPCSVNTMTSSQTWDGLLHHLLGVEHCLGGSSQHGTCFAPSSSCKRHQMRLPVNPPFQPKDTISCSITRPGWQALLKVQTVSKWCFERLLNIFTISILSSRRSIKAGSVAAKLVRRCRSTLLPLKS